MQERKIILVSLMVAIVVIAIVSYECFEIDSLSGCTEISLSAMQTYSVRFGNPVCYNITLLENLFPEPGLPITIAGDTLIQVSVNNSMKTFATIQGDRYSFSGLQIVVGKAYYKQVGSDRDIFLNLYVKSAVLNSKPIITSEPYIGT